MITLIAFMPQRCLPTTWKLRTALHHGRQWKHTLQWQGGMAYPNTELMLLRTTAMGLLYRHMKYQAQTQVSEERAGKRGREQYLLPWFDWPRCNTASIASIAASTSALSWATYCVSPFSPAYVKYPGWYRLKISADLLTFWVRSHRRKSADW